jgi:hypothetical protein
MASIVELPLSRPLDTPQRWVEAYLAEMRKTGAPPSKTDLWLWAKAHDYPGTRQELLQHFPANIAGQGGRPRGRGSVKRRRTTPDEIIDGGEY